MAPEWDHEVDLIVPTHDHAPLLELALQTARAQTVADISIIVIGDGVGDDTREVVAAAMDQDPRIEFHDLPKGSRTGEAHRHSIIERSTARFITYLCDDDLLFPDHVEKMASLLERFDVVMPPDTNLLPDGLIRSTSFTLEGGEGRRRQLQGASLFGLCGFTHTVDAYRRLPEGWSETPEGFYTDQYMILKFLRQDWCRIGRGSETTTVQFQSVSRRGVAPEIRRAEMERVYRSMTDGDGWAIYRRKAAASRRRHAARTHPVGRVAGRMFPRSVSQALRARRSIR